jgi:putative PIN family toxin of toxin-antitoxin system
VIDTGVLISALLDPQSASGKILRQLVEQRSFELILSAEIVDELTTSLADPRVRRRLGMLKLERERFVAALCVVATFVAPDRSIDLEVAGDPADVKYLTAAMDSGADFVVSKDPHLLDLEGEPQVVSPRMFLEGLEVANQTSLAVG